MKKIIFITGPSNSGKDTIRKALLELSKLEKFSSWNIITMHTTRPARKNESFGVDYYFETLQNTSDIKRVMENSLCFSTYTNITGEQWYYWIDDADLKEDKTNVVFAGAKELKWMIAKASEEGSQYKVTPVLLEGNTSLIMERATKRLLCGNDHEVKEVIRRLFADVEMYGDESFVKMFHSNVVNLDGVNDLLHVIKMICTIEDQMS